VPAHERREGLGMAGSAGIVWQSSPAQMAARVEAYGKRLLQAVYALASEWASRLAGEMKATAPWTDRTGAARSGLFGRVFRIATGAVLVLGHSVHYGIYLERRWGGRYATVSPTIQRNLAAIMASLQRLVR